MTSARACCVGARLQCTRPSMLFMLSKFVRDGKRHSAFALPCKVKVRLCAKVVPFTAILQYCPYRPEHPYEASHGQMAMWPCGLLEDYGLRV
eukprot:364996-Chlamydomonas_euryale.AAC.2